MRASLIITTLLLCPACAAAQTQGNNTPQTTEPQTAEQWLDRIEHAADQIHTLQAKIRYDRIQGLLGDEQRRFGVIRFDAGPPVRVDVHFETHWINGNTRPIDMRYTFDGRWGAERNAEDMLIVRREFVAEDDTDDADPLDLAAGPFALPLNQRKAEVLERFDVELAEPADDDPENSIHLHLTPKPDADIDETSVDLWYDRDSLLLLRAATEDDDETRSVYHLRDIELNVELDNSTFDTTPPTDPGWEIEIIPLE